MISVKLKFRPSSVAGHEGSIYYQIIYERKVRQILSGLKISADEWDKDSRQILLTDTPQRRALLLEHRKTVRRDIARIQAVARQLESTGLEFSADDIVEAYARHVEDCSLTGYMTAIIARMKEQGRIRTSETYTVTLKSFLRFRGGKDILLDSLTAEIIESYETWLKRRGVLPNTSSFYMRVLRAVYNRAVRAGLVRGADNPFRDVYTGVDRTEKRALPLVLLRKIRQLDLSDNPTLEYARDMFMLSFFLRGMSFIDMAYLRLSDLKYNSIVYRRRKTGRRMVIGWTREMQQIVDRYPRISDCYLLPIISRNVSNERAAYRNAAYRINHALKTIARMAGITIPLTLYVARHSWASTARGNGIPLSVISEGMGHESETTTRIYLASLDTSVIDRANAKIIASV